MSFVNIGTVGKRIHPSNYSLYLQKLNIKPQITINPFILQISLSKVSLSWELTKKKCPSQIFVDRHALLRWERHCTRINTERLSARESYGGEQNNNRVKLVARCIVFSIWGVSLLGTWIFSRLCTLNYFCENSCRQEPMTIHCLLLSHTSPPNSQSFFLYSIFLSVWIQHFEVFKASSLHKLSLNQ